ncbi:hypothetical protein PCAR4_810083 [Paraburkholderia caribensis]|nr:hypothetical protein PCAR4_810083 [Paraburkholderia caribensis]
MITFPQSNWLASIVVPHQPHFIDQPKDVEVLWGYGLSVDQPGNFVNKSMTECTGREIMSEILGHLHVNEGAAGILDDAICIPCFLPYITSQFLTRKLGDRPQPIPAGWTNLAFIGQFCELQDDVVFTVEYSVRSARTAVYRLLKLDRSVPDVYDGGCHLRVLYGSLFSLRDR